MNFVNAPIQQTRLPTPPLPKKTMFTEQEMAQIRAKDEPFARAALEKSRQSEPSKSKCLMTIEIHRFTAGSCLGMFSAFVREGKNIKAVTQGVDIETMLRKIDLKVRRRVFK